jgi:integrase/recombinase XerC
MQENGPSLFDPVLSDVKEIETLKQGLTFFETIGMPAPNLSARTRKEYQNDLTKLIEFLEDRGVTRLKQVSLRDLENYQAEMDRRGFKASTRERKTYAIKSFFRFLHYHGMLATNVASRLIPPRRNKPEPRFLSEDEYQRLLQACSHNTRDAAIIEALLQTGMRLSELTRLTIYDVEIPKRINREPDNTGTVRVTRKGGNVDTIPLNYKACRALNAWLQVRPKVDHPSLFVTKFHTPMGKRAIQYTVYKYLQTAGIRNASVHTLRHTMATHHIARGTDPKTIQETLGHASLETTVRYIALAKKAQRKALQEHAL